MGERWGSSPSLRQRVRGWWQMGSLPLPLGKVCTPSLMGEQQPWARREVILSGKEGRFPPLGVGRVKNKGQVPKSDRMLKSPSSPHTSSLILLPSNPFPPHPTPPSLLGRLLIARGPSSGCKPGGSAFTPNLPGCSTDLSPSPFPPPPSAQTFPSPHPSLLLPRGVAWM